MKIRVFTAFSGYDSQCLALDRLSKTFPNFEYELVGWAEIDKYAIQSHNALYPQWADRNYGDISKVDWEKVPDFDLFTYSSPCQDFSSAGLQRGGAEGSGTRSSLLWECRRAILAKKPKYLLLENVAALVSQKFLPLFNKWQAVLERYGYTNYAQVLNAKDYGVPQNRDRIFLVSILNEHPKFYFPKPFPLILKLKDVLETEVEEKYYLSDTIVKGFEAHRKRMEERGNGFGFKPTDGNVIASSVLTHSGSRPDDNYIIEKDPGQMEMFDTESEPLNPAERGKSNGEYKQRLEMNDNGTSNTITSVQKDSLLMECTYRIRKLTPRECYRLMGVDDADIDTIQSSGISNTQQYKQAGNAIVVDVLYHIFRKMFMETESERRQLDLF